MYSLPDSSCPVVSPLDEGARFQVVASQLVDVFILPGVGSGPKAEWKHVLTVTTTEQRDDLPANRLVLGIHSGEGIKKKMKTGFIRDKKFLYTLVC